MPKQLIPVQPKWTVSEIIKEITVGEWKLLSNYIYYSNDIIQMKKKWDFRGTNVQYADALEVYVYFTET